MNVSSVDFQVRQEPYRDLWQEATAERLIRETGLAGHARFLSIEPLGLGVKVCGLVCCLAPLHSLADCSLPAQVRL